MLFFDLGALGQALRAVSHRQVGDSGGLHLINGSQSRVQGGLGLDKPVFEAVDVGGGNATFAALCVFAVEFARGTLRATGTGWASASMMVGEDGWSGGQSAVAPALFGATKLACDGVEGLLEKHCVWVYHS